MSISAMTGALLLAFFLVAQDTPPETCTLSGSVVSSVNGEPLNHVEVIAEPVGGGTSTTDGQGNFTLVDLKGRRNGYLSTYYGARRAEGAGTTIALESGAEMKDIPIKLPPFAVLAGTVREVAEPHQDDEGARQFPRIIRRRLRRASLTSSAVSRRCGPRRRASRRGSGGCAHITGLDIALPRSRVFHVTGHITAPTGTVGAVNLKFGPTLRFRS